MSPRLIGLCMFLFVLLPPLLISYFVKRPLVIKALLAGYNAKPKGAGLGHDKPTLGIEKLTWNLVC